jgi:hypothetical protein
LPGVFRKTSNFLSSPPAKPGGFFFASPPPPGEGGEGKGEGEAKTLAPFGKAPRVPGFSARFM